MRTDILQQAQAIRASMDAAAIVLTDEQAANAPTVYRHIETCLHEMKSDLEETNYE